MDITINLEQLIRALTLFMAWVLCVLTLFMHKKNKPLLFIGIYVFLFVGESVPIVLQLIQQSEFEPRLYYSPLNFYFAFPVILYLYFKRITGTYSFRKDYIFLIPGLAEFLLLTVMFFTPWIRFRAVEEQFAFFNPYFIIACIFIIGFSVFTIREVLQYQQKITAIFSSTKERSLRWIVLVALAQIALVSVVVYLNFFLADGITIPPMIGGAIGAVNMVFVFGVAISGILQPQVLSPGVLEQFSEQHEEVVPKPSPEIEKEEPFAENFKDKFQELDAVMQSKKPYLNSDLNSFELAKMIDVSPRKMSKVIRAGSYNNFNDYVNHYRVEEAKQLLVSEAHALNTIVSIGGEAGFNSRASFYSIFKRFTSYTPKQYQDQHFNKV